MTVESTLNTNANAVSRASAFDCVAPLLLSLLLLATASLSPITAASTDLTVAANTGSKASDREESPSLKSPTLLGNLSEQTPHWLGSPPEQTFAELIQAYFNTTERSEQLTQLLFAEPSSHSQGLFSKLMEYTLLTEAGYWCRTPVDEHDLTTIAYLLWLQGDLHIAGLTLNDAANRACTTQLTPVSVELDPTANPQALQVPLTEALYRYQARHGLQSSGELDAATLAALQTSPQQQLHVLKQNLERLRANKLQPDAGTYIIANIPDFNATVFDQHEPVLELKAIVGKKSRPTPEFNSSLVTIVVNPTWNIPSKLMYRDVIPKQVKNPDYLAERNIKIIPAWGSKEFIEPSSIDWKAVRWDLPYKMSQQAGPKNALGKLKFLTPNKRAIYLHDTNARGLFKRDVRAFSSGCVRIQHPEKLAEFLLARNEQNYNLAKLIKRGSPRYLAMKNPINVHYVYWTAWVDQQGQLQHRKDIYEKDTELKNPVQYTLASASSIKL